MAFSTERRMFRVGHGLMVFLVGIFIWTDLEAEPVDLIDPFVGSVTDADVKKYGGHGLGKTFPGATTPFGQVQLSPDTITGGDNGPGYSYTHKTIEGFSFTHMSGIGFYGDFGNFQVMPTIGHRVLDREKACSPYSHAKESACAGYYRVSLDRYGVEAEVTASRHAGLLRFVYPKGENARVQVDLARRIGQKTRWLRHSEQSVRVVFDRAIEGRIVCPYADGGWGHGLGQVDYTIYYHAAFSHPFVVRGVAERGIETAFSGSHTGTNVLFFAEFGPLDEPLVMTVGISFMSLDDARENHRREAGDGDFERVRAEARTAWADALNGISITGGSETERTIFTTALYHAFIDPREIGRGELNGHPFVRRTVFSGWDVFRSAFPLYTLLRPDVVSDTINSMMETVTSGRRKTLPRWDIFGCAYGCMIGQPIVSVMADAWEKGIRSFDGRLALDLVMRSREAEGNDRKLGYTPGKLSETLEYAYFDWCCARLAESLGEKEIAARYDGYAQAYRNCWNCEVGWMRARTADGGWLPWEGRERHGQGCVESNPWQQGWFVPHDSEGLMALMGGREYLTQELEKFFSAVPANFGWNDAYNHPNEPCHTIPFLWAHSTRPSEVSKWTRKICAGAYGLGPYGLCGNEDVGQMSAWYVLASIGLHPLCPGDGKWYVCAPLFDETTVRLDPKYYKGNAFVIRAAGATSVKPQVVQIARLNGMVLHRPYVLSSEIFAGGVLELELAESK